MMQSEKAEVVSKTQCPECARNGNDTSKDNLVMYATGTGYCFACGYTVATSNRTKRGIAALPYIDNTVLPGKPSLSSKAIKSLGITQFPLMRDNKILGKPKGEKRGAVIAFPYYSGISRPTLVRYKVRDYTVKKGNDRWFWPTSSNFKPHIFGLNKIRFKNTLVICEGESDTIAAYQWLYTEADVIGISGTGIVQYITEILSHIRTYNDVYVCMDADSAGDDAKQVLYEILPSGRTRYVELPNGKDFYDIWSTDKEALRQAFETAYQVTSPSVLNGDTLVQHFFDYLSPSKFACYKTGIRSIDKMLGGGLFPGEVLGLAAHSGHGKTSLVMSMVLNLIKQTKVFVISTEMDPALTLIKLLEADLQQPFVYDNKDTATLKLVFDMLHKYKDNLMFYSQGAGNFDDVYEACQTAVDSGCRIIICDVLSDIDSRICDWQKAGDIMRMITKLSQGDSRNNVSPVAWVSVLHTKMVEGKYRSVIQQEDVLGGKAVMAKHSCGIAMTAPYENGSYRLYNPRRFLSFFKLPRMRPAGAEEGHIKFQDFRYV